MVSPTKTSSNAGFALIVALTLMAFVTLLLVTLTTLTRVESQAGAMRSELSQARANAVIGLNIALGELQKAAGPDQRVTATAELSDTEPLPGQKYWTGVWDVSGQDSRSIYAEPPEETWLVSGVNAGGGALAPGTAVADSVTLLTDPNEPGNEVVAGRVEIFSGDGTDAIGHYAYWVGDEGVKAKVNLTDPYRDAEDDQTRQFALMSAQRSGVESISLADGGLAVGDVIDPFGVSIRNRLERLSTARQYDLVADGLEELGGRRYHDVTTSSYGVLANVKDGGLREDLSLAFEMDLSDFNDVDTFAADGDLRENGANHRVNYLFRFDDFGADGPSISNPMARGPTWHLLRNYYRLYKSNDPDRFQTYKTGNPGGVQRDGSGYTISARPDFPQLPYQTKRGSVDAAYNAVPEAYYDIITGLDPTVNDTFNGYANSTLTPIPRPTDMDITPVLLRIQAIISVQSIQKDAADPETGTPATYVLHLQINPVVTIWNPYNVALTFEEFRTEWRYFQLDLTINVTEPGSTTKTYNTKLTDLTGKANSGGEASIQMNLLNTDDGPLTLGAGETRVFTFDHLDNRTNPGDIYPAVLHPYLTADNNPQVADGFIFDNIIMSSAQSGGGSETSPTAQELEVEEGTRISFGVKASDSTFFVVTYLVRTVSGYEEEKKINLGILHEPLTSKSFSWPSESEGDYRLVEEIANTAYPYKHPVGVVDTHLKPVSTSRPAQFLTHYNPRASSMVRCTGVGPSGGEDVPIVGNWYLGLGVLTDWGTNVVSISTDGSGYWGRSNTSGASRLVLFELPTLPLQSLAAFQHVNNVGSYAQQPAYPIGNSYASPFIPKTALTRTLSDNGFRFTQIDWSYLCNEALWDGYFFSTLAPRPDSGEDDFRDIVADFVSGETALPNSRMHLHLNGGETTDDVTGKLVDTGTTSDIAPEGYARSAENLLVEGAFNVNSTSIEAWKAILSATNGLDVDYISAGNNRATVGGDGSAYSRMSLPGGTSSMADVDDRWSGFRQLDEDEITVLAEAIVDQVKERGPFSSLADFVNRRLTNDDTGLKGALQTAIDNTDINEAFSETVGMSDANSADLGYPEHAVGQTASGAPGYLRQSDLLMTLGPVLTARSDSFVIRAYGDTINPLTGQKSVAWCEAVVQRLPEYVDSADAATERGGELSDINRRLGRRFEIVSFRWLDTNEI